MRRPSTLHVILLLVLATSLSATEVHWVPAHDLAPPIVGGGATAGDLDGDGDPDVSMFEPQPVWHYWNTGTPESPSWVLDLTQYAGVPSCVLRTGSLGDVDADGDLDLVVCCWDDDRPRFYRNTGTSHEAAWQYEPEMLDDYIMPLGGATPCLVDFDADGDLDLMVTRAFGHLGYARNMGTPSQPMWVDQGLIDGIPEAGPEPTGAVGDLDGDGDMDFVRLTWDTPLECWENIGTAQAYEFVENPAMLTGIDEPSEGGYAVALLDIDADGDVDLLAGGWSTMSLLYLNETTVAVQALSWGRVKALYR